ncbi:MAG: hypothetical protein QG657_3748 [Acidobacteriota bacterium]|nr:hypothetical protein [Acidobacteriota bacterium]
MILKKTLIGVLLIVLFISPGYCEDKNKNSDSPIKSTKTILTSKDTTQTITKVNAFDALYLNAVDNELSQKKLKAEVTMLQEEAEKLKAEVSKLREETDIIKNTNNAPDKNFRWLTVWLTALGGIILGFIGFFLNRTLNRTQKGKMEQEEKLNKEKHMLEVFRHLGSGKRQIRIGAAAILIQRLKKINENDKSKDEEKKYDLPMIANFLLSVTKHEDDTIIQKYIADGLVKALGAIVHGGKNEVPSEKVSILKMYDLDFQKTKLYDVWWKRIDARGVDFFGADLVKAGLRESFLQEAIFYEANLTEAILIKANLESTNLQKAILKRAKFTRAKLTKAILKEADLTGADLVGAILNDVDLSTSIIDGADFTDAIFNKNTKLKRDQLGKAKFNDDISQIVTLLP